MLSLYDRNFPTVYFGDRATGIRSALLSRLGLHFRRLIFICSISTAKLQRSAREIRRLRCSCPMDGIILPLSKDGRRGSIDSFFGLKNAQRALRGLVFRSFGGWWVRLS